MFKKCMFVFKSLNTGLYLNSNTGYMSFSKNEDLRVLEHFTEKAFHRKCLIERPFDLNTI
jgi:hypothetical protein